MHEGLKDRLGADLLHLIDTVGSPLTDVVELTTLPSGTSRRGSLQLQFEDGRVLKGRRFQTTRRAELARQVLSGTSSSMFPPMIGHHGAALLEVWVEGEAVDGDPVSYMLLTDAGDLLGQLHGQPSGPVDIPDTGDANAYMEKLSRNLRQLSNGGALDSRVVIELEEVTRAVAPTRIEVGFVHGDFRPQNLLRDRVGKLVSIDSGSLGIGALDEDLARTLQRWPMTETEREVFLNAYQVHRDPGPCLSSFQFWLTSVLANSARVHFECGSEEAPTLLRQLTQQVTPQAVS